MAVVVVFFLVVVVFFLVVVVFFLVVVDFFLVAVGACVVVVTVVVGVSVAATVVTALVVCVAASRVGTVHAVSVKDRQSISVAIWNFLILSLLKIKKCAAEATHRKMHNF